MSKLFKKIARVATGVTTGGISELARKKPFGINTKHGQVNMPTPPNAGADMGQVQQQEQYQRDLLKQTLDQQRGLSAEFSASLDKNRQNAIQDLTTGPGGEQLRQQFNRLGLLNSGAFNTELANRFGQIQKDSESALMDRSFGNLTNLTNQGFGVQSDLGLSGLQRQFGLEDMQYNGALQQALAKRRQQGDRTNAFIGLGGSILGQGIGSFMGRN